MDVVYEGRLVVAGDGEHVYVAYRVAYHLALGHEAGHELVAPLHLLGLLEAQLAGQPLHLVVQRAQQPARVAFKYLAGLLYAAAVVLHGLLAAARASAVLYVVVEAQAVLALLYAVLGDGLAAGARVVELLDKLQHGVH